MAVPRPIEIGYDKVVARRPVDVLYLGIAQLSETKSQIYQAILCTIEDSFHWLELITLLGS